MWYHNSCINTIISMFTLLILLLEQPVISLQRSELPDIWSELVMRSTSGSAKECPLCMKKFNENILRYTRLESIKKAILEGLGMTEPPKINAKQLNVPFPIFNGDVLGREYTEDKNEEDSTSKHPSKVVIVSTENSARETENGFETSFKIEIPWNVHTAEVNKATLWLYTQMETNINKCGVYSKPCGSNYVHNYEELMIDFKDGWSQLDITSPLNGWLEYEELCREMFVTCNDQMNGFYYSTISDDSTNKPFIVIDMFPYSSVTRNRNKRNINCVDGATECCRERLVVSFADIKWDNWIIQPRSYEAFYCKGKCDGIATISLGNTPYNSVLHHLKMGANISNRFPEVHACCAPTQLAPLDILYYNQNGSILQNIIPNMSVTSCGCT